MAGGPVSCWFTAGSKPSRDSRRILVSSSSARLLKSPNSFGFTACPPLIPLPNSGSVLTIEDISYKTFPSVVHIKNGESSFGAGIVWGDDRFIVTNYHVVRDISSDNIRINLKDDSTNYSAQVLWHDEPNDIAVLRTNVPRQMLTPIPIGVSANVRVGQKAFAIGHPKAYDYTVTDGIISAIRQTNSVHPITLIQTNAAINPGNSGGPLLDSYGHLIGVITSTVLESNGLGFAISADTVVRVVNRLMSENSATQISGIMLLPDQGVYGVPILDAHQYVPPCKTFVRSTTSESYNGHIVDTDIICAVGSGRVSNGTDLRTFLDKCRTGDTASSANGVLYSKFVRGFLEMNFPEDLVLQVIKENGEEDQNLILSVLLSYAASENSPEDLNELPQPPSCNPQEHLSVSPDTSTPDYDANFLEDLSDVDGWSSEYEIEEDNLNSNSERHNMLLSKEREGTLSENEQKLLALVEMGYTIEEASIAMERCGPDATISVLTDHIFTAQIAREQDCYLPEDTPRPRHSNGTGKIKKRKLSDMSKKKNVEAEEFIRLPNPMIGYGVPSMSSDQIRPPIPEAAKGPPFFYYENVALAPKGAWDTISRFLYEIPPEFVDSKHFSATARKRGYIHNLPIESRFPLVPLPPMNIFQAFPLSKRFWPPWDPRDKMNCIQTALGSAKLSERIRTELEKYDTVPPPHVQKWVLYECRKWNLIWTGKNKVAPLEPDEMETLLGFPKNHTRGGGISRTDRIKSLGNSFQVDTVAYHLSVLKKLYPNGMNILTLFSGIGSGEVSLNRLGITLNYVVSVEKSKMNRDIVRSWWEQLPDEKRGILIDFDDVQKVDDEVLEKLRETIGGFDLIIGGSPCNNLAGSNRVSRDGLEGKESSLFFEYFRILDAVRSIMRRRAA